MQQGTREAITLSEVLRTNANVIDHFNLYLNHCQDRQLHSILDRQQRHNLDSTQKMMHMIQNHGLDTNTMPQPISMTMNQGVAPTMMHQRAQWGTTMPAGQHYSMPSAYQTTNTIAPTGMTNQQDIGATAINDRIIADGMLAFLKCSAETCTRAALESAEPHLRQALTNMARNSIEMSFEIYNYMHGQGWYQLPSSTNNFISHAPTQQQQQQQFQTQ